MPLLRFALRASSTRLAPRGYFSLFSQRPQLEAPFRRGYASGKKQAKSTSTLVPGSQQPITDPAAQEEYAKAESSMKAAVEWYRKDCASLESRTSGRVTPALLSPVRVKLPDSEDTLHLDQVATVGIREGSTLLVTVFDEDNTKHVEHALYDAKIAGVVPQRQDSRTIRIPIPKPTVDAKLSLYASAQRKAEEMRVQIRRQHQSSLKRGKYAKRSVELEEFQKLTDRYIDEVDKILANLKKSTGAK